MSEWLSSYFKKSEISETYEEFIFSYVFDSFSLLFPFNAQEQIAPVFFTNESQKTSNSVEKLMTEFPILSYSSRGMAKMFRLVEAWPGWLGW